MPAPTLCQDIVTRAANLHPGNPALVSTALNATVNNPLLAQIRASQARLYTKAAEVSRDFFQTTQALTSTGGASARVFDLSPYPVERVLQVLRSSDGVEISQVDLLDTAAELPPRYIAIGRTMVEVGNDWAATPGPVTATLYYVQGPVDIDPAGLLTQAISLPEPWTRILVYDLGMYLSQQDVGRDPAEIQRLQAAYDADETAFHTFLKHYSGVEHRRFDIPAPMGSKN